MGLDFWKHDAGAVAAEESVEFFASCVALFAFQPGRDAADVDHEVGAFDGFAYFIGPGFRRGVIRSAQVDDLGTRFRPYAFQRCDDLRRESVVVAQLDFGRIGIWSEYGDAAQVVAQRKQSVVLEQHHGFVRHLQSMGLVRIGFQYRIGKCGVRIALLRIECAESEPDRQQPCERFVDHGFGDKPPLDGFGQVGEDFAAVQIGRMYHGIRRGRGSVRMGFVVFEEIVDRSAVRSDVARELPFAAQNLLHQQVAGAARLPAEPVIGAHHGAHVAVYDQVAECWQVGVP